MITDSKILVKVRYVSRHFTIGRKSVLKAVDDVSFEIYEGETFGLVGESGCGKSTLGRTIIRLDPLTSGTICFDGVNISGLKGKALTDFRKNAQIIFQDPYASLNPRMTIGEIVAEGLKAHYQYSSVQKKEKVTSLLNKVGLDDAHINRYPHELSGGQRQRVGIARALSLGPRFIVCDEPTSALDVSIQSQVINLLTSLQHENNLTYLFISHDLSVVRYISDRVGVMYLGSLIEVADNKSLYSKPMHPYTQALFSAIPVADPDEGSQRKHIKLLGEVPSPTDQPSGCKFHPRCRYAQDICEKKLPELQELEPGHLVACHFPGCSLAYFSTEYTSGGRPGLP